MQMICYGFLEIGSRGLSIHSTHRFHKLLVSFSPIAGTSQKYYQILILILIDWCSLEHANPLVIALLSAWFNYNLYQGGMFRDSDHTICAYITTITFHRLNHGLL